jgi:2-succinyl-5-enolpyruvyl-6-hydroxy-3-cyclohexene-1-carboxylate synthase
MSVPTAPEDSGDADTQAAFTATVVDEWVRGGVTDAVVCPGSRSAPLAVALAAHRGITVHARLDERSAGFTALGMGRATGRPALVVTTSGTAAVELHPAMVEADLSGVPLIACTADRPPELWDVGAPQTVDQTHLFGRSVRWFADPGVPIDATRSTWRSLASRSVVEACVGAGGPGPVHLNLPFREPLLGDPAAAGGASPGRPDGRPWHEVVTGVTAPAVGWVRSSIEEGIVSPGRRGLVVAGAGCGDPAAVLALSVALGWPVLAEPRSGLRVSEPTVIATADGILRSVAFVRAHAPEVVLRLGEPWVSKVVNGYLSGSVADGAAAIVVAPAWRWTDPEREVSTFVRADPTSFCAEVTRTLGEAATGGSHGAWLESWQAAEATARHVIGSALGGGSSGTAAGSPLHEPSLAYRLFARLPSETTLVVSSSMPVRDLEAFGLPRARPPRVLSNRGANGIDGVVSTALGVALASSTPTVALVGDLAFLHDVSALVCSEGIDADLTVVVADNGGGGIFSFLPPASALDAATFDELFGTPQTPDPAAVAAGLGWPVDEVGPESPPGTFEGLLDHRVGSGGLSVIRVLLPDRDENVAVHARVNDAVADALDADGSAGGRFPG